MTDNRDQNQKRWIDEADEALKHTGDALKAAWDQTRDARMAALETAKEAAHRLGEAIDQGIEVAKQTWDASARERAPADSAEASFSDRPEASNVGEEE